jgi:SAM-dependent methyltransferase
MPLLDRVREAELEDLRRWVPPGARVLEIGGGSGYQARILASWGCVVRSIDLAGGRDWTERYFEVEPYDGTHIPFPDAAFDVVFSSNVLHEVPVGRLPALIAETRRVLAPSGVAIHALASATWRVWTNVCYYPYVVKRLAGATHAVPGALEAPSRTATVQRHGVGHLVKRAVLPPPLGAYPNAWAEIYYFSRARWIRFFRGLGFEVVTADGNGIFYTGIGLVPSLSIDARRRLARVLGSSGTNLVFRPRS